MPDSIYPGAVENEDYYIVKPGDTLLGIAERFIGNAWEYPLLTQINDLDKDKPLKVGTVLLLHPAGLEKEK